MTGRICIIVLLMGASTLLHSQNPSFAIGDDILEYFNETPPPFKVIGREIVPMEEGRVDYYKYKEDTSDEDIKFLVIMDKYVIGVWQNDGQDNHLLFDMNGDGILDSEYGALVVPFWVLSDTDSKRGNNNILTYFDRAMNQFNGDENPYSSGNHQALVNDLLMIASDPLQENRDLFFALYNYYFIGNHNPWDSMDALHYLSREYWARFDFDHDIFYLHTAENALNMGDRETAKAMIYFLLETSPDFVPGKVYRWQLEEDEDLKEEYYEALKKEHPDHWIVVQI